MMKTVLITGSTRGIGLGIARQFAKTRRYNIVFNGLDADGREIALEVSQEFGISTMFDGADMQRPVELQNMIDKATARFGHIDVLVNNAGIQHVSPIEDFSTDMWQKVLDINLTAAFHLTKAVWRGMKERKFGRIINIASAHGLAASEYKSAYIASKHGLVGFTKVLALEGAPFNITVNAICPGYVKTPLVDNQITDLAAAHALSEEEAVNDLILKKHAVKEFVPIELLGQLAVLMASEEATTFTGVALPVDGGWTAQ